MIVSAVRKFLADTTALITFSTVVGAANEIIVARMSVEQSVQARLTAIPIIMLTARPYGVYRDWVFRLSHADRSNQVRRMIADIVAFTTFQIPIYIANLLLTGATVAQIITACASAVVILVLSGRPYGLLLELFRRIFGVPSSQ